MTKKHIYMFLTAAVCRSEGNCGHIPVHPLPGGAHTDIRVLQAVLRLTREPHPSGHTRR
jgi:hypothetical protein